MARPNNDHAHVRRLRGFYAQNGCLPSYGDMAKELGFRAKNAAFMLAKRLIQSGHLVAVPGGRLAPGPRFFVLELAEGAVRAGIDSEAPGSELLHGQALEQLLVLHPSKTRLVRVRGESMVDVGILSGDIAVVETGSHADDGDIVIAEIDGNETIKEFKRVRGKPTLVPHGIDTEPLVPRTSFAVIGVVTGIARSYRATKRGLAKPVRLGGSR